MAEEAAVAAPVPVAGTEPVLASGPPVKEAVEEKPIVPLPPPPGPVAETEKVAGPVAQKAPKGSLDRDVALAQVETEKKLSYIKAWEEDEKAKANNKAEKKLAEVTAWENSKKAAIEAELKKIEERIEKKKADYGEVQKNKIAAIHKQAEEKRAMTEAKRQEDILKAQEMAAKYKATNQTPKAVGCLGC